MNGLYPIIRRKRRPLSVPDVSAAAPAQPLVEPVPVVPLVEALTPVAVEPAALAPKKPKSNKAKSLSPNGSK